MTRNSRAQDAFQQIMEFGSSHVLLVRSGGPTASLNNVASGPPHEVSAAQVRYVRSYRADRGIMAVAHATSLYTVTSVHTHMQYY